MTIKNITIIECNECGAELNPEKAPFLEGEYVIRAVIKARSTDGPEDEQISRYDARRSSDDAPHNFCDHECAGKWHISQAGDTKGLELPDYDLPLGMERVS